MLFRKGFKIDKKLIASMRPTSKASLKQMCLLAANGDIDKAQKLYDYMAKDMDDLPLFDTPQPTAFQQVKQGMGEAMQWINQNQETIFVWADILRGFFGNKNNGGGGVPPAAAVIPQNPIPNIN